MPHQIFFPALSLLSFLNKSQKKGRVRNEAGRTMGIIFKKCTRFLPRAFYPGTIKRTSLRTSDVKTNSFSFFLFLNFWTFCIAGCVCGGGGASAVGK